MRMNSASPVLSLAVVASVIMATVTHAAELRLEQDEAAGTISVIRHGDTAPILTQQARQDFRPYIHPLVAPDGKGVLTQYSPSHHKHQTGLYWGFTRLNGRDFFHHPGGDHWRRISAKILHANEGSGHGHVQWQTVYELLDEGGNAVLTETQIWTMHEEQGEYVLDLQWTGQAHTDVTIGEYNYGGLFLRMPWHEGVAGQVLNAARQQDQRAEGQRAPWIDVAMQVPGRDDLAHVAIFDHPQNEGYPQPWRVDGQMGVGPVRARLGDWTIKKGELAIVRHRLLVYTGKLDDVSLTRKWGEFSGHNHTAVLWGIAQQEGRAAEFLSPQEAVGKMTLPDGFQANVYASEPMITQPMAFCWDDRGRLWVAENRDYEDRGSGFSRFGDSRILILEDTDRDGEADSRKVFLEGIPFPAAIAVGFDGLWLGAPPNLLFVPDRNHDDVADTDDIEIRLTGWGIRDRHETLNSLHWGPDGWLYGCQGYATPSQVGKPAGKGRIYRHNDPFPKGFQWDGAPTDINGGVWRYHPTEERFEVVAHGFSNPWGIDYDAKGQLFITACVIPHLWHVVPGGIYHRQGGRHFNSYVYSDIRTIADHRHRSAHGGARIYLSDAFPAKYHRRIFMANIHEHAVLTDILERRGSGFVGRHGDDFLLANNAQWIGFSMEIGPEGAVYVLDWHDADICGKDVLHKDTGRIYRITPTESLATSWPSRYGDLNQLSNSELVSLQTRESAWHARRARLILQHRSADGGIEQATLQALRSIFRTHADPDIRLRSMWALHAIGKLPPAELQQALRDQDEYVRAWAIQFLCEDLAPPQRALQEFVNMAASDQSPVVRLYLAAALQRIAHTELWPIAERLVARSDDANDHNIPKMIWFGIEPLVLEDPRRAIALAADSQLPLVTRHIARRLTDGGRLKQLLAGIDNLPQVPKQLMLGIRDGLEGRFDVAPPAGWERVYAKLASGGHDSARIALELAQQFGDATASRQMLATLQDPSADLSARRQAIRGLAGRKQPQLVPLLVNLLDEDELRQDAIRAMASFDHQSLASALLSRYDGFSDEHKLDVIHTLASRPSYGRRLTDAIHRGDVPRRDIPAYVARLLRRVVGNHFADVWGSIDPLSVDKEAAFIKFRSLLAEAALQQANASHGRNLFQRTCMTCHKMYGEGGQIGPEITGANRTNIEYLLGNILTPSAEIQDDYRMLVVLTDEGRIYSGVLAGENERQLSLRVAGQDEPVVIAKSQIESREIAPVSMMPEGLLNELTDAEVLDLVAYLRSEQQVPLAETSSE